MGPTCELHENSLEAAALSVTPRTIQEAGALTSSDEIPQVFQTSDLNTT